MTKTHESTPKNHSADYDEDREMFLSNNDRGFETPVTVNAAKKMAKTAFNAIAIQIESGHNID